MLNVQVQNIVVCRQFEEDTVGFKSLEGCILMVVNHNGGFYPCWVRQYFTVNGTLVVVTDRNY